MASSTPSKAKLTINFDDGSSKEIIIDHALMIDVPGESIGFNQNKKGAWNMYFKPQLLEGKNLAKDFLTVSKI